MPALRGHFEIDLNNTHHATMEELVIGKNLRWMDRFRAVHEPEVEYVVDPTSAILSLDSP